MQDKYLVILLNCASPWTEYAFFLMTDEDDNTRVFDTEQEAKDAIEECVNKDIFAASILCTGDFVYQ